jgi:hypothetical protein
LTTASDAPPGLPDPADTELSPRLRNARTVGCPPEPF